MEQLVSRTEQIDIDRSLDVTLKAAQRPLKDALHQTSSLPGVAGDYVLTKGEFGDPGSRRIVCLTDNTTVEEQVLERDRTPTTFHLRYVVWNYTTPKARPIAYGVGNFLYSQTENGNTHITWTYSFQLNQHRFTGYLGALGKYLFRWGFLDGEYAELMRNSLSSTKSAAEANQVEN